MATLKTTLAEIVKNTTSNMTILMAIEKQAMEEEARTVEKNLKKIHQLIKRRSNLIGMSGMENRIAELTVEINALRV